jgi:hypothetical protein
LVRLSELLGSSPESLNCPLESQSQSFLEVRLILSKQPRRQKIWRKVWPLTVQKREQLSMKSMLYLIEISEHSWISDAWPLELVCESTEDG